MHVSAETAVPPADSAVPAGPGHLTRTLTAGIQEAAGMGELSCTASILRGYACRVMPHDARPR